MIPKKTKIVCTIGPATSGVDELAKLIDMGMDVARLNFSHGSHADHQQVITNIREASEITGRHIAIMQDLQGPKIRTRKVENGAVMLEDGQKFVLTADAIEFGTNERVSVSYKKLVQEVKAGGTILLDDGYIILDIVSIEGNDIVTKVYKGGKLKDRKGIIAPGVSLSAPSMSEKDMEDLKFGLECGVDAVALSFVKSEKDVLELRTAMKIFRRSVPIISKIERLEAYQDIEKIIHASDGIMVARGDLGLEMPAEEVPAIQKEIIGICNYYGKPVITATQMLESMIENPRPTRAEASDVANAVLDGTDCVMLSAETSVGRYPFDAIGYMDRIIRNSEKIYTKCGKSYGIPEERKHNISDALGKASSDIADQIKATAIVPFTNSAYTAMNIAKYRPKIPIVALTSNKNALKYLSFVRGVHPIFVEEGLKTENIFRQLGDIVKNIDYIDSGDTVVFLAGLTAGDILPNNAIKIFQV